MQLTSEKHASNEKHDLDLHVSPPLEKRTDKLPKQDARVGNASHPATPHEAMSLRVKCSDHARPDDGKGIVHCCTERPEQDCHIPGHVLQQVHRKQWFLEPCVGFVEEEPCERGKADDN